MLSTGGKQQLQSAALVTVIFPGRDGGKVQMENTALMGMRDGGCHKSATNGSPHAYNIKFREPNNIFLRCCFN